MNERDFRILLDGEAFETRNGKFIEPERVTIRPAKCPQCFAAASVLRTEEAIGDAVVHRSYLPAGALRCSCGCNFYVSPAGETFLTGEQQ